MAGDRLSALDASFIHIEDGDGSSHMHVAACMIFAGDPPDYDEFVEGIEQRLHLVPRYRQRLATVPFGQGRPKWVDDPHLNLRYHVRATALPAPGAEEDLRALAGRIFAQPLDRDKPLWELWLVEGLEEDRFAVLSKTHHALVDGVAGVDLISVLFDSKPEPDAPPDPGRRWTPQPLPSGSSLLAEALVERATVPAEVVRSARAILSGPRRVAGAAVGALAGVGALAWAGLRPAAPSPYNVPIGPHRRFAWTRASLDDVRKVKSALDGTVNDVVLTVVAGALGRHLRRRGVATEGLEMRAFVPVSVRSDDARGDTGNQVAGIIAPLPVGVRDAHARFDLIHAEMRQLKGSAQPVGTQLLTELTAFAPPNVMSQASRLAARQRFVNLVVTNVPGPQYPLYLSGREMLDIFPLVPLAQGLALGVAIMSYNGRLNFGLLGDYDAMSDIEDLADDLSAALKELAGAAGVRLSPPRRRAASDGAKADSRRNGGRRRSRVSS